jgi:hypothetical protein
MAKLADTKFLPCYGKILAMVNAVQLGGPKVLPPFPLRSKRRGFCGWPLFVSGGMRGYCRGTAAAGHPPALPSIMDYDRAVDPTRHAKGYLRGPFEA